MSKKINNFILDLDSEISQRIVHLGQGFYRCAECDYETKYKTTMNRHVESKHLVTNGIICNICQCLCPTKNALATHRSRLHKMIV